MTTTTFTVPNISCGHCVNTIQNELMEFEGVISAKAEIDTKHVAVEFQDPATENSIRELLVEINYPAN